MVTQTHAHPHSLTHSLTHPKRLTLTPKAQPPLQRFTRQVNSTKEPRQTSSYVSLLNAGAGEFVVTYELRKTPDEASRVGAEKDTVFAMRVTVNV